MYSAHYVPRIIETFAVVNRYIRLTFRRVYYKCVNAAVLREIELYMSRKARSAESYRAGSSDGLYQVIVSFDLWRCKLRLLHKPVVFDNDGLRHNTLSGSDFLYRRNLTRHGRVHGCAYILIGIAYYLTYKNSVADLYRWRTRRADMLAHRKRDRFRSRNAFNLHILGVLFVRNTYTASDFFYRFYYFRAHSSSSLYSFIYIMKLWHNGPQYASRDGPRNKSRQKKHRGIAYNRLSGNHNRGNRKLPCIMSQSRQNTYFYISCVF